MTQTHYDAIVIGAGPGGYPAAIRLAQLGVKTLLIEKEAIGGVCLNWGCIPSKALIAASSLYEKMHHSEVMGITASNVQVDVTQMQTWKNGIVKKLTGGIRTLVTGHGADIAMGQASFIDAHTIEIVDHEGGRSKVTAQKGIVIATGTKVIQIPGFDVDGETIITAREAVNLSKAPEHLVVIGGGVIGLELGTVYLKLGSKVTIVELTNQILPGIDVDLVKVVQKKLEKLGATILTGTKAIDAKVTNGKATVSLEKDGKSSAIDCDKILVAVGFKPNTENLGLEKLGVQMDGRGHITVDEQLRTRVPHIFSVGDVRGGPYLAHKATKEGETASEVIAGHKRALDLRAMPAAIFTDPEIATVGMNETAAKAAERKIIIGKFPFSALGRAMAMNETEGYVKVIIDENDHQVLGVCIVGPEASNLISEAALALEMSAFAEDISLTVHPHPTLGEGVMEAFKVALGECVHVLRKA